MNGSTNIWKFSDPVWRTNEFSRAGCNNHRENMYQYRTPSQSRPKASITANWAYLQQARVVG